LWIIPAKSSKTDRLYKTVSNDFMNSKTSPHYKIDLHWT
jgi:hypothetical protein